MGKIIVAGSINMDIITRVAKLPLTGETISGRSVEYLPGGKGLNQAVACAKMGAETILAGSLGNDLFADNIENFLKQHHINTDYIKKSCSESGTAFITVADNGQNTIVVVSGANADLKTENISSMPISAGDIIISQFEISDSVILALFQKAKQNGAQTILNPSPIRNIPEQLLAVTDILIVNETELGTICKRNIDDKIPLDELSSIACKNKASLNQNIIITLGSRGVLLAGQTPCFIKAHKVDAVDTVGAGDCFAGVLAAHLLKKLPLKDCIEAANKAAALCVTRKGAAPAMPSAEELSEFSLKN